MSLDVQAGVRMVGDSKRGNEVSPPIADGEGTLIGVASGGADDLGRVRCSAAARSGT